MAALILAMQQALAGVWAGCLGFTMLVVSPALKRLEWSETTRVLVRSEIGRHFGWLASPLLLLLMVTVILGAVAQPRSVSLMTRFVAELVLLFVIALLSGGHALDLGRRIQVLAAAEEKGTGGRALTTRVRARLQKWSFALSMANLLASVALVVLIDRVGPMVKGGY